MEQAFYRKWRPRQWDQVIGQDPIIQTLRNAVGGNRVAHAYLFAGARGTGKTTTARLLAKAVNCTGKKGAEKPCDQCDNCLAVNDGNFLDLIEIDAASNTSVDDVRDLRDKINFTPNRGQFKVYIIDEVHMLSGAAFNALLKTLEEPPPHAIFILATTEIHKIPPTVLSRCQRYEFRRVSVTEIAKLLQEKSLEEKLNVDSEVFPIIARQATGSFRDAISLLDQLASTGQRVTIDLAQQVLGTAANQSVINLVDSMIIADLAKGLEIVHQALDGGSDPRQYARQVIEYLRGCMLAGLGNELQIDNTREIREWMINHSAKLGSKRLLYALDRFSAAAADNRTAGWQPALPLEMALAECILDNTFLNARDGEQPLPRTNTEKPPQQGEKHVSKEEIPAKSERESSSISGVLIEKKEASEPGSTSLTLEQFRLRWEEIRSAIKKVNPGTQALVNSCMIMGIKNGVLTMGFRSEILKQKMESNENINITRQCIRGITGEDLDIRCLVSNEKAKPPDISISAATDGMVNTALRDLGGQVVKVQKLNGESEEDPERSSHV
jgi:DNA polymerase-3 subunit gamma/tau